MNKELVRSLHVYRFEDGNEKQVEREFLLKKRGSYVEMMATPIFKVKEFRVSDFFQGRVFGVWLSIFVFDAHFPPTLNHIPPLLLISGNAKLKSIPRLADDLKKVFQLTFQADELRSASQRALEEAGERDREHSPRFRRIVQDLNCLPDSDDMCECHANEELEQCASGNMQRRRRAASEDVAKISLNDLVKYFDLPILEASRNLKVGLTVLKKKCREFGIPRWPHRKIKSLDSLIHELQDVGQQQKDDEVAVAVVTKRQEKLKEERESIERKPFMEIQTDTKKFRQDVFKRRHKARALKSQGSSVASVWRWWCGCGGGVGLEEVVVVAVDLVVDLEVWSWRRQRWRW
ncbi:hypothetical protein LWI29_004996 [Acer saccharum]|uniref:RWP-RK domain-containing protein n=1 Tax=Acer saccharum TaxID=4024 RepID=A0AA39W812_ACESA|nr:hypothetical protein LWI29_004996 [Acer saccharum]